MEKIVLPLSKGIGVIDKNKLCVCVVDEEGNKKVGGQKIKTPDKLFKIPFLRGLIYFGLCVNFYIKAVLLQEKLVSPECEEDKANCKRLSRFSILLLILSLFISIFLVGFLSIGFLPSFLYKKFLEIFFGQNLKGLFVMFIRLIIFFMLLALLRFMPFMQSFYSFNGAGNAYLKGKGEKLREINYPLNFLNLLANVSVFSIFVISLARINVSVIANFAINLAIMVVLVLLVYEMLRLASEKKWQWLGRLCLLTNSMLTIAPKTTHKEVLAVAKREIENFEDFVENGRGEISMSALYAEMETKLNVADKYEESDIDWIIATVLKKNRAEIKLQRSVDGKSYREILKACDRRAKGEPLSNIFGFVDFYGLRFDVNKKVLSPRMDTEVMVEAVIKRAEEIEAESILDLCTGSGAIAVTLAKYTNCKIYASDISKQALAVAMQNAKNNDAKVEFSQSDLTKGLKKSRKYDIIVSNPPYIKSGDIEKLDVEVKKYDPRLALDGGEDGLDFYRRIVQEAPSKLAKKGWLYLEVGKGQADDVCAFLQENGFTNVSTIKDYNKIERVVYGRISK